MSWWSNFLSPSPIAAEAEADAHSEIPVPGAASVGEVADGGMDPAGQPGALSPTRAVVSLEKHAAALSRALDNLKTAVDGGAPNRCQIHRCFDELERAWRRRLACSAAPVATPHDAAESSMALERLLFPVYVAEQLVDSDFYRLVALLPTEPRADATPRRARRTTRTAAANHAATPSSKPSKFVVKTLEQCAEAWGFGSRAALLFFLGARPCSRCYALERIIEAKEYNPGLEWKSFYSRVARCSYERRGIPLNPFSQVPAMSAFTDEIRTKDVTNAIKGLCPGLANKKSEGHNDRSERDDASDDSHDAICTPCPSARSPTGSHLSCVTSNTYDDVTEMPGAGSAHKPADAPQHANKKRGGDTPPQTDSAKKMRRESSPTTAEHYSINEKLQAHGATEISDSDGTETARNNDLSLVLASMDDRLTDRAINAAVELISSLRCDTFYLDPLPAENRARLRRRLLAHRLTHSTRVLAPIHIAEIDHWVLCVLLPRFESVANSRQNTSVVVQLFDSLPLEGSFDQAMGVLETAAQAVIRDEADEKAGDSTAAALVAYLRKPQKVIKQVVQCPRQVNSIDCGIATIVNSLVSVSAARVGAEGGGMADYRFEERHSALWRAALRPLIHCYSLDTEINGVRYPKRIAQLLHKIDTAADDMTHVQTIPAPSSPSGMSLEQKRKTVKAAIASCIDLLKSVEEELDAYKSTVADLGVVVDVLKKAADGANFELLADDVDGISTAINQLGRLPNMLPQSHLLGPLTGMMGNARGRLDRGRRAYRALRELTVKLEQDVARISGYVGIAEREASNAVKA